MNIGPMEIAVILILALIILGPKRLPQAGRSIGQAVRELKKATAAARNDLGIDDVAAEVKDLKSNLKVGLDDVTADVNEVKSSLKIDLNDADKPAAPAAAAAATATIAAAPPAEPTASRRPRTWQTKPAAADQPAAETPSPAPAEEPSLAGQPDAGEPAESAGSTTVATMQAPTASRRPRTWQTKPAAADDAGLADESCTAESAATNVTDQPEGIVTEPADPSDALGPAAMQETTANAFADPATVTATSSPSTAG